MDPINTDLQNESASKENRYTVRQSKIIAAIGIVCAVLFAGFILLALVTGDGSTEIIWIILIFLVFMLLGLFLAVYALKWRIEVEGNTLTVHHPFKRPNVRSLTFDEITSAKNGMNGLYVYEGDKKAFTVDTFAVGRGKLSAQLLEMSKFQAAVPGTDYQMPLSDNQSEPPDSQEFDTLKNTVIEIDKPISGANGIAVLVAIINVGLGAVLTFFSGTDLITDGFLSDFGFGIFYLIPGLLFVGLSLGVPRRSRTCLLIATIYLVIDGLLAMIDGVGGIAFLIMRVIFIISLIAGVRASFKYHTSINDYATKTGGLKSELIKVFRPKIQKGQVILCSILGCIAIFASVYGFATGAYAEKLDIDDWVEYSSGSVTIAMPSSYVDEYSEEIPGMFGVKYISAISENQNSFVFLVTYQDLLINMMLTADEVRDFEYGILDDLAYDFGADIIHSSTGHFPDGTSFFEIQVVLEGEYGVFRSFSAGNDVYAVGIFLLNNDGSFFHSFLDRIVIN